MFLPSSSIPPGQTAGLRVIFVGAVTGGHGSAAEAVAEMKEDGQTVEAIAEALKVSNATARRFLTNLALAQAVEAGDHDAAWKPGTKEVVVHTVVTKVSAV